MNKINENILGYKKTKVGWIPEEWGIKELKYCGRIIFSNVDKKSNSNEIPIKLCNYTDVYYNRFITNSINFMKATANETEINRFRLKKDDVIITKDSETPEDIAVPAIITEDLPDVLCGYHLAIIRSNRKKLLGEYLLNILQTQSYKHYFYTLSNGVTRFGLTSGSMLKAVIPLPTLTEQKKIASILSTWDKAIEKMEALIAAKEKRKKGLMQQLLTGKKRLPGFDIEWQQSRLGEVFKERAETGYNNLPLLSITDKLGVILQIDTDKKDSSNIDKSKYKRIFPGDIGYNTMRMWQGRSALSLIEGIVSPAYTIVTPKKQFNAEFIMYLFKFPPIINLFYRHSQGLVSDTLNLKYKHFKEIKINLPDIKEQKAIADILKSIDKEINLYRQELAKLKVQKKGLMQVLLTGKIRVKV